MTIQTDASTINGLTLASNFFYAANASSAGTSSINGVLSYNGTVTSSGPAGISGTISATTSNGFFSVTSTTGAVSNYQILGSTTDGANLIFSAQHAVGTNSGPYYILANNGTNPGSTSLNYDSGNSYAKPTCFLAGTLILTPDGERLVEELEVGDLVFNADGIARRIVWTGSRSHESRCYFRPRDIYPVLVEAEAFGTNVPSRDLYLSLGHSVACGEDAPIFTPVENLINGMSIRQVAIDSVSYWHFELESHDAVIANGAACETFLDVGNRIAFPVENGERDVLSIDDKRHDDYRYPFHDRDMVVAKIAETIRRRALDRAGKSRSAA